MRLVALILLTITASAFADPADNWAHWRGPLATGVSPTADPPITWDAKTNIKWKVDLPGKSSASPIVWGDRVFVITAVETDRRAKPEDIVSIEQKFERKTNPPTNYH